MKVKIYRGTKEIGGTCIELIADNGKILWIDLGLPLSKTNHDIEYAQNSKANALLISHPHQDHYGLIENIKPQTPIYIGQVSRNLIDAAKIFMERPLLNQNFKIIEPWKTYEIENTFKVTPFLVDHSSPEAFAFLIEADEKKVFYSGDFRATGRKKILYENLIKNPPYNIDLLLLEGTMIERNNRDYPTEQDVENAMLKIFKEQQNVSFVISSAQNIDRFVSVHRACKQTGKIVVVDIYNAWVLDMVRQKSESTPSIEWNEVKVFKHPNQWEKISDDKYDDFRKRIIKEEIRNDVFNNPSKYVYFLRCPSSKFIDALRPSKKPHYGKINLIYSQWDGYLKEEYKQYYTELINGLKSDNDFDFHFIHTSGHATLDILKQFAKAINPKLIVPIHTEYPEKFQQEFMKDGINNIEIWEDKKEYKL